MSKLSKLAKDLRHAKLSQRHKMMLKGGDDKRAGRPTDTPPPTLPDGVDTLSGVLDTLSPNT